MTSIRSNTFGGNGGVSFDDSHVIESWGPIRQLVVRHGTEVDAIGVFWANGNYINHGGTGGSETVINLAPGEFISGVDGRSGDRLDQITLHSNVNSYGPFGGGGGNPFSVNFVGSALQYLFGRAGSEVDQIGFAFGDQPPPLPSTITRSSGQGGQGGSPFDDLSAAGDLLGKITSIAVRHGSQVDNIAVSYQGQPSTVAHGGPGGTADSFDLAADEWVTEVRGRSGSLLDQVQFVLNSGRVSPTYGGNGGNPFTLSSANSVVKAFFGRSGSEVDQLGVYFEDAKPVSIEIVSMNYDLGSLNVTAMPPQAVLDTDLKNASSIQQQVTQTFGVETTDTDTTTVSETSELSVQLTAKSDFFVAGSMIQIGLKEGVTYTTEQSHSVQTTHTVEFQANVPPTSVIHASCIVRQSTYDVSWTAIANVTYQDQAQPTTMTLHGTLKGVTTTSVGAQYDKAQPLPPPTPAPPPPPVTHNLGVTVTPAPRLGVLQNYAVVVKDASNGSPVSGAQVDLDNNQHTSMAVSDASGLATFTGVTLQNQVIIDPETHQKQIVKPNLGVTANGFNPFNIDL